MDKDSRHLYQFACKGCGVFLRIEMMPGSHRSGGRGGNSVRCPKCGQENWDVDDRGVELPFLGPVLHIEVVDEQVQEKGTKKS